MYTPQHIANYFLSRPKHDITNLKLNKLVYIAYGWALALGTKLFDEPIKAWRFGPVIPTLYYEFKHFRGEKINCLSTIKDFWIERKMLVPKIPEEKKDILNFLEYIWKDYDLTAQKLVNLTHNKGTPWWDTYYKDKNTISDDLIKKYYGSRLKK